MGNRIASNLAIRSRRSARKHRRILRPGRETSHTPRMPVPAMWNPRFARSVRRNYRRISRPSRSHCRKRGNRRFLQPVPVSRPLCRPLLQPVPGRLPPLSPQPGIGLIGRRLESCGRGSQAMPQVLRATGRNPHRRDSVPAAVRSNSHDPHSWGSFRGLGFPLGGGSFLRPNLDPAGFIDGELSARRLVGKISVVHNAVGNQDVLDHAVNVPDRPD